MSEDKPTVDEWKNSLDTTELPPFGNPYHPLDINGDTLDVGDVIESPNADLDNGRFLIVIDLGEDHFITYDPIETRYFLQYVDFTEQDVNGVEGVFKNHHQQVF